MEKELFDKLKTSVEQAGSHAQGRPVDAMREYVVHVPEHLNVKSIRQKLSMTQKVFAETFGFSLQAVKHWETDRRQPEAAAKVLLNTIAYSPETVILANQ